ncbi:MAG TPA: methyltransferase domain-containing protein [Baekduia sp.]|nr:methyltransferase domain-containing protein [Baekduia sp.]
MPDGDDIERITERLVSDARAGNDPTGWFEPLYAAAAETDGAPPWTSDQPRALLRQWIEERGVEAAATTAVVVGCGLGADAEYIASLGFATTAFDVSPTAIRIAREQHPGTTVDYGVADLFALPAAWRRAFDLVVECWTVQALPDPPRGQAIAAISDLVAPGGTLIVVALARDDGAPDDLAADSGPPWPQPRAAIEAFATDGVELVDPALVEDPERPGRLGWRAEYRRPR